MMNNKQVNIYTARARSDPSSSAGVRGDPQALSVLWIDPPEQIESKRHPPEVRHIRNGPPVDSARGKSPEIQKFIKAPRAESDGEFFRYGKGITEREGKLDILSVEGMV